MLLREYLTYFNFSPAQLEHPSHIYIICIKNVYLFDKKSLLLYWPALLGSRLLRTEPAV